MFVDTLIAIFFFLIGVEIKNSLRTIHDAIVPIFAALDGMIFPAIIFLLLNPGSNLWATAMPTDIALALGVLLLLGKRVNVNVRLFLLTLAVADDFFSLIVMAIFYGDQMHPERALSTLGAAALGLMLPLSKRQLNLVIKVLTPITTYFILPVIILVNIPFGISWDSFGSKVTLALVLSRFVGKIVGIVLFSRIALRFGAQTELTLKSISGIGALAGIGMTVSLVIAEISATNQAELNEIRVGLFISALLSGVVGYIWLKRTPV